MILSKQSWMLFGLAAFGLTGCGGADWSEAAQEGEAIDPGAELSEALTDTSTVSPKRVLSLGDSIAFGFNPLLFPPAAPAPPTSASVFVGYPEVLASTTYKHKVTNISCPGETSNSYFDVTKPDNGCRNFKAAFNLLHVNYETTQAEFAIAQVQSAKSAGKPFERVTLNIGANDLFVLQAGCQTEPDPLACIQARLPGVIGTYRQNLEKGAAQLKTAGYANKFVGISTYAINYSDPLSVGALTQLNGQLKEFTESLKDNTGKRIGTFVDVFAILKAKAAAKGTTDLCVAGFLIKLPDGSCDIHPNKEGRDAIAKAVNPALK